MPNGSIPRDPFNRRDLLRLAGAGSAAAGLSVGTAAGARPAWAAAGSRGAPAPHTASYAFNVARSEANPDGAEVVPAVTVNGSMPGPEIRAREGDILRIQVANGLQGEDTTIHWHGLLVPSAMDGVPDLSQRAIEPGGVFLYEYPLRQNGTYWYHSHVGLQEQVGLYGGFVVEARDEPGAYDHDQVVLLSDWLHRDPNTLLAELRTAAGGDRAMTATPGAAGMPGMRAMSATGERPGTGDKPASGGMDLSDVRYDSFLLNGRGGNDPWAYIVRRNERVRLRIINAGASTVFRFMIDGHPLRIVAADGQPVEPVEVDSILIGMGEVYDVIVTLRDSGAFLLRGEAQDGSGQAIGILRTADALSPPALGTPAWGPRQLAYAQLRSPTETTLPPSSGEKSLTLDLTGKMTGYVWSINEQVWPDADPLIIAPGDRVRVQMTNRTGMWHPMHLHGHFFRLLQPGADPRFAPLMHTVSLPPQGTATIEFLADNPGRWFFHCHNLYHLEAGMAREWIYRV